MSNLRWEFHLFHPIRRKKAAPFIQASFSSRCSYEFHLVAHGESMINLTFARKCIDITWGDLLAFIWKYMTRSEEKSETEICIEKLWCPKQTLVAFTVRSGFDLCLQAYAFPPGSEVIVSAVTIPDMVRILEFHQLIAVPVDIQIDGTVSAADIEGLITSKTTAILIAHLFGNRMDFDDIVTVAKNRKIVVFEDCAEAFCGSQFTGHHLADVSMFSFGLIKTSTALGGGLLTFRDSSILSTVMSIQSRYETQQSLKFWIRVAKYSVFKALTDSPAAYGTFLAILNILNIDHHVLIRKVSRSFEPEALVAQIRKQPSAPLLQLLKYRLSTYPHDHFWLHQEQVIRFSSLVPDNCRPIGFGGKHHVYWLCPIMVPRPDILLEGLYNAGFDAADGGTSLAVISSRNYGVPPRAREMMKSVVYVPMDHSYELKKLQQLAKLISLHQKKYKDDTLDVL